MAFVYNHERDYLQINKWWDCNANSLKELEDITWPRGDVVLEVLKNIANE